MFCVFGQDFVGCVKSLDCVEILGVIFVWYMVWYIGEQYFVVWQCSGNVILCFCIFIEEIWKGGFWLKKNVEIVGLG